MSQPKFLHQRGGIYYVRRPIPLDVQPAFGGRKEVWRSLGTRSRREAEAKSHAVLAELAHEFEAKRLERDRGEIEASFLTSPRFDAAAAAFHALAGRMELPVTGYAPALKSGVSAELIALGERTGQWQPRPLSRTEALRPVDIALGELEAEREGTSLVSYVDEDGEPAFVVPTRYVPRVMALLGELFEADRRTLEAQRAVIAGTEDTAKQTKPAERSDSLGALMRLWEAQRMPAPRTRLEMETAIARFERVNGALVYSEITDEHARRFKTDLLGDAEIKNATRQKLWGMLRALLNVAVEDGLHVANPFARVKLRLDNGDAETRETLTRSDLVKLFGALDRGSEDWWLARIALYAGARLGEVHQMATADIVTSDGEAFLHIRPDPDAGRRVKTASSVRKVPIHRQLIADGFLDWASGREPIFTGTRAAASKRLNRRMHALGLGEGKVFHSLRHTFKAAARLVMGEEFHDRLTGHAPKNVGRTYGDYRDLKAKIDLVTFGIETA